HGPVNVLSPPGARDVQGSAEFLQAAGSFGTHREQSMHARGPLAVVPLSGHVPDGLPLKLVLDPQGLASPESHEITVAEKEVVVRAGGSAGLARAMLSPMDRFEERGGPFLERGTERRDVRFGLRLLYPYTATYAEPFLGT